jgi:hypothetical protein
MPEYYAHYCRCELLGLICGKERYGIQAKLLSLVSQNPVYTYTYTYIHIPTYMYAHMHKLYMHTQTHTWFTYIHIYVMQKYACKYKVQI